MEHKQKPPGLLEGEAEKGQMDAVVQSAVPAMSKVLGKSNEYERGLLRQKLGHAGFHSPHTVSVFLAIKAALMIGLGVLAMAHYRRVFRFVAWPSKAGREVLSGLGRPDYGKRGGNAL